MLYKYICITKNFKFFIVFVQWKSLPDTVSDTRGQWYSDIPTYNVIYPTNKLLVGNISVTPKKQMYVHYISTSFTGLINTLYVSYI